MKSILVKITALSLACVLATDAGATSRHQNGGKGGDGGNAASQAYAAAQALAAQQQEQSVRSSNSNKNSNDNSNSVDASSSNANLVSTGVRVATGVAIQGDTVEGSVSLAALGAAGCDGGFGITAGAPGAGAFGFNIGSNHCKELAYAVMAQNLGGSASAYLCASDRTFRNTQQALCNPRAAITDQQYDGGKVGAPISVSTRTTTPVSLALYTTCEVIGNTPNITVPYGMGSDADYVARAAAACWSTR